MKTKDYRDYYERLAQARKDLRKKLAQKVKAKSLSLWSINYRMEFKEILYEMVSKRINAGESPIILDVGCGSGEDLSYLSKVCRFTGCGSDLSLSQLKMASSNDPLSRFKFVQADVQNLPFKNSSFDMVICSEVIEHLPEAKTCLKEIQGVLRDDGLLFLTTPSRYDYFHTIGQIIPKTLRKRLVKILRGEAVDIDSSEYIIDEGMAEHLHLFSPIEIKSYLEDMGFSIEEIKGGRLSVPFPRIFDRFGLLQRLWVALDKALSLIPLSIYIKVNILIVGRKR